MMPKILLDRAMFRLIFAFWYRLAIATWGLGVRVAASLVRRLPGFYMIAAIVVQLFTGWMRVRGLEAKGSNFSLLHRVRDTRKATTRA